MGPPVELFGLLTGNFLVLFVVFISHHSSLGLPAQDLYCRPVVLRLGEFLSATWCSCYFACIPTPMNSNVGRRRLCPTVLWSGPPPLRVCSSPHASRLPGAKMGMRNGVRVANSSSFPRRFPASSISVEQVSDRSITIWNIMLIESLHGKPIIHG